MKKSDTDFDYFDKNEYQDYLASRLVLPYIVMFITVLFIFIIVVI